MVYDCVLLFWFVELSWISAVNGTLPVVLGGVPEAVAKVNVVPPVSLA